MVGMGADGSYSSVLLRAKHAGFEEEGSRQLICLVSGQLVLRLAGLSGFHCNIDQSPTVEELDGVTTLRRRCEKHVHQYHLPS